MKNINFVITLIVFAFITSSCSKSSDCEFVGEWCLDSGSAPCIDPVFGIMTAAELNIKANGELILVGTVFEWESDDCITINLNQEGSPEKAVWTASISADILFLDFGFGSIQEFHKRN